MTGRENDAAPAPAGARVALTYRGETDDAETIVFSRTVSPLGVGAYRVDGSDVSRDAYEAKLRSIGVLVQARNFLVFQGDVESLAAKSSTELTALFEQTSGSESLRDDYEGCRAARDAGDEAFMAAAGNRKSLALQRRQIKGQRDEADRYVKLAQDLDDAKREHLLWLVHEARTTAAAHAAALAALRSAADDARDAEAAAADAARAQKCAVAERSRAAAVLDRGVSEKRSALRAAVEPDVALRREADAVARRAAAHEGAVADQLAADAARQADALADIDTKLATVRAEANAAEAERAEAEGAAGAAWRGDAALAREYETVRAAADAASAETVHDLARARRACEADLAEQAERAARRDDVGARIAAAAQDVGRYQARAEASRGAADAAAASAGSASAELETLAGAEGALEAAQRAVEADAAVVAEELRESGEGGPRGAQSQRDAAAAERAATLKRLFPGVRGRLVDVCAPVQRRFAVAVATAVGKFAEAIVVDTRAVAQECLGHLRDQRLGTCIFLPLDTIEAQRCDERLRGLGAEYRLAVDVIHSEPDVAAAVAFAAGDVVICDSLDDARMLCYGPARGRPADARLAGLFAGDRPKVKAVTLDGAVIAKTGNMTGGNDGRAAGGGTGRAWRDADAQRLQDKRAKLEAKLADLRAERRRAGYELPRLRREVAAATAHQKYAADDGAAARAKMAEAEAALANLRRAEGALCADVDAVERKLEGSKRALAVVEERVVGARSAILGAFAAKAGVDVEALALDGARRASAARAAEAVLAKLREREARLEAQRLYEAQRDLTARTAAARRRAAAAEAAVAAAAAALGRALAAERASAAAIAALASDRDAAACGADEARAELKRLQGAREAAARSGARAQRDCGVEEAALEKLRSELHNVAQRAQLENVILPLREDEDDDDDDDDDDGMEEDDEAAPSTTKVRSGKRAAPACVAKSAKRPRGASAPGAPASQLGSASTASTRYSPGMMESEDMAAADRIDTSSIEKLLRGAPAVPRAQREAAYADRAAELAAAVAQLAPNLKAAELFDDVARRLKAADADYARAREARAGAARAFDDVRAARRDAFVACFDAVSSRLAALYTDLTQSARHPRGGSASLSLADADEPYLGGVAFHATPPGKRFVEMHQLSGGERTLASLALLFALHAFHAAPFMIMDEVDAALDTVNVDKLARFVRGHAAALQIVAVSLKDQFYGQADSLVGVAKDVATKCSVPFVLDIAKYGD
ncbi:hypothetical protein M885DRAFT_625930 [Pelagophyceae sp. CCMP2097]|nr:hypothetical protein M885DRAFT_625930 [Pelagophyceae sp. CCMP2097]